MYSASCMQTTELGVTRKNCWHNLSTSKALINCKKRKKAKSVVVSRKFTKKSPKTFRKIHIKIAKINGLQYLSF